MRAEVTNFCYLFYFYFNTPVSLALLKFLVSPERLRAVMDAANLRDPLESVTLIICAPHWHFHFYSLVRRIGQKYK